MSGSQADWQARPEAGTTLGLRFLLWVARHLGRGVLHTLMWPVSVYFLIRRAPERRASLAYLSRVLGRPATWTDSLRHFHHFATVAGDRVYFLLGEGHRIPVSFVLDPESTRYCATTNQASCWLRILDLSKRPGCWVRSWEVFACGSFSTRQ